MRGLIVGAAFVIACGTSHARGWRPGKPEHDNRMRRREVAPAMRDESQGTGNRGLTIE